MKLFAIAVVLILLGACAGWEMLAIQQAVFVGSHPAAAMSLLGMLHSLGGTNLEKIEAQALEYLKEGQYSAAEPLYEYALEQRVKRLGKYHPSVARTLYNLGWVYSYQNKYSQAASAFEDALVIWTENGVAQDDSFMIVAKEKLAEMHHYRGDYIGATRIRILLIKTLEKAYGAKHPKVADVLLKEGEMNREQGDYASARLRFQHALDIREAHYGATAPELADPLHRLGAACCEHGSYSSAEQLLLRALEISKKWLGENHPNSAAPQYHLGMVYHKQKNHSKALPFAHRALEMSRAELDKDDPSIPLARELLTAIYEEMGEADKAAAVRAGELPPL